MIRSLAAVLLLVSLAASAPVAEQMESERPLVRAKRADEQVVFGNHQSKQRIEKKSDPGEAVHLDKNDKDKKAAASEEARSVKEGAEAQVNENAVPEGAEQAGSEPGKLSKPVSGQMEALERLMSNSENELEGLETSDSFLEGPESSGDADGDSDQLKKNEEYNYVYDDFYNPWEDQFRKKRSAKKESAALTAESMDMAPKASQRFKRDLTQDQIRELLENVVEDDAEKIFSQEPRDWPEEDQEEEPGWTKNELETLLTAEDGQTYGEGPAYTPTEAEEEEIEIEEAKARLALVRLLQEEVAEAQAEAEREQEEEVVAEALEAAVENNVAPYRYESENEIDDEVTYLPIVYEGVPGVFIPMENSPSRMAKRQYLSLVPGMRKRAWYPTDNGDRWQALMPSEEKRNQAEAYERLYRLAQALNRKRK